MLTLLFCAIDKKHEFWLKEPQTDIEVKKKKIPYNFSKNKQVGAIAH